MVCSRATAKGLTQQRMVEISDMDIYALLFPEKEASNTLYAEVDYDYVTPELRRTGVTMKLLHEEYVDKCRKTISRYRHSNQQVVGSSPTNGSNNKTLENIEQTALVFSVSIMEQSVINL